jgi:hypothetical protein
LLFERTLFRGLCTPSSGRLRSFSSGLSYSNTRRLANANTDHRRSRSPGTTTAAAGQIRDSQGSRHHSKHGRALFAQAWQRLLQGSSETVPQPPPRNLQPLFTGLDIRRTRSCDPCAGCGTEKDIPTAERSKDRNDAEGHS